MFITLLGRAALLIGTEIVIKTMTSEPVKNAAKVAVKEVANTAVVAGKEISSKAVDIAVILKDNNPKIVGYVEEVKESIAEFKSKK